MRRARERERASENENEPKRRHAQQRAPNPPFQPPPQVLDRRQEAVAVLRLDCALDAADRRGAVEVLLVERAPAGGWVNLHACFRLLPAPPGSGGGPSGREFLWRSERDGHGHLYAASLQPLAGQRLAAGVAALEPGGVACSGPLRRLTARGQPRTHTPREPKGGFVRGHNGVYPTPPHPPSLASLASLSHSPGAVLSSVLLPSLTLELPFPHPLAQGPGAFDVEEVAGLHNNQVYYMGTAEGRWCERHLFQAPLFAPGLRRDGRHPAAPPTCLTAHQPGYHHCVLHAPPNLLDREPLLAAVVVVDTHSTVAQPPTVDLCTLGLGVVATSVRVFDAAAADPRVAHLGLAADASAAPQLHTFASADNQVHLAFNHTSSGQGDLFFTCVRKGHTPPQVPPLIFPELHTTSFFSFFLFFFKNAH